MKFMPVLIAVLVLSACAPKSDVDEANKKIAELQAQAAAAQAETEKIKAQAAATQAEAERIKAEAEVAKSENEILETQNSQLQAKIEEKPELPVTVTFRKSLMGKGNVAIFNTKIKSNVPVLITFDSAALGTSKKFELRLDPSHPSELGHLEGALIENGDTLTIENQNYSPLSVTVSL